jgi:glutamate synthase domain-containing protein 2
MGFIAKLRELSQGKPVGIKLCVGHGHEFMAMCKAMIETEIMPDFIVVDGAEGGTGAAPLEFVDHLGMPLREGLSFAQNCLIGAGLRDRIKLAGSGRIVTAFDMARVLALGADWCNAARAFMFALGCVQSMSCHTDRCPTGVATQNPLRQKGLDVEGKAERVRQFHDATLVALAELTAAAGLAHPAMIGPQHIMRRVSQSEVKSFAEVYPRLSPGALLEGAAGATYQALWSAADAASFAPRHVSPQLAVEAAAAVA